jgi:NAD(P)-dependent dehydrogenase (short-subunit alcohol dehydrogenase family)
MYPELKPYVVLITGGASGLGLAAAHGFAKEGATIVIADLQEAAAVRVAQQLGSQHLGLPCDVADEAQVNRVVDTVIKKYGRVDVLINCAGVADRVAPTVEQDMAHFRRLVDIHLTGTYMMTKACAVHMLKQGKGNVINISSNAGVIGLTYRNAYSAAKAGISMITRTLGCEWGAAGIRVNAIAPGYILTPLTQAIIDEGRLDKSIVERRTPMGRMGEPRHIADAMLFLASDQAEFITGVTLPVDGGYTSWGAPSDAYTGD